MSYEEIKNKEVTVRNQHRCVWCNEPIGIGERAQYRVYIFGGDFKRDWMHPECYEVCCKPEAVDFDGGFAEGENPRGGILYN